MINKDTFDNYSIKMVDILDLVQSEMVKKIARQLWKGRELSDNDWKVLMLNSANRLDEGLTEVVKASTKAQAKEVMAIRDKAVNVGLKDTDEQLSAIAKVQSPNAFKSMKEIVINTIAEKLTGDVVGANLTMLNNANLDYLKNINDVLAVKEMGGITRTEATKQILSKWAKKGVPALVDSRDRRWQPDSYVNMVVRTNSMNIAKKTQERRAVDYGQDLIITSQHADQSPEHAQHANKIFSLSGNDPNYDAFSVAEADTFMSRPNCRHTYSFYVPGLTTKRKTIPQEKTDKAYKVSQEQRKLERNIRAQKRVIDALKPGSDSFKADFTAQKGILRDKQADMRKFIDKSGRTRQRDREQI